MTYASFSKLYIIRTRIPSFKECYCLGNSPNFVDSVKIVGNYSVLAVF